MITAQAWHEQACRKAPTEPTPVSALGWERLHEQGRQAHLHQLRGWMGSLWFETATMRTTMAGISRVVDDNRYTAPGAKRIAAISGPYAVGKSTMINRWAREQYRTWIGPEVLHTDVLPVWTPSVGVEADLVPIVRVNLQANARIKEFDAQVLQFLGLPAVGVARSMTSRLTRAIARHGVRVVIVDDVHLLKTNWKGGRDVLDHLKHVNTEIGEHHASLVLVGAELGMSQIVTDPQIAARLELFELTSLRADIAEQQQAWCRVLGAIETQLIPHLPDAEPGFLGARAAGLIWRRTQGYIGDLAALIAGAVTVAYGSRDFTITSKHLRDVRLSARAEAAEADLLRTRRKSA